MTPSIYRFVGGRGGLEKKKKSTISDNPPFLLGKREKGGKAPFFDGPVK